MLITDEGKALDTFDKGIALVFGVVSCEVCPKIFIRIPVIYFKRKYYIVICVVALRFITPIALANTRLHLWCLI